MILYCIQYYYWGMNDIDIVYSNSIAMVVKISKYRTYFTSKT